MKKIYLLLFYIAMSIGILHAQNDTMYVMKDGAVIFKQSIKAVDVDSIIFYKPVLMPNINITTVQIPAGTFMMGSPIGEIGHNDNETEHQVTLSAFHISKYEITNAQYASFLNAKSIGNDGLYMEGAYPTQALIYSKSDYGLIYTNSEWLPVKGYEKHPVINVTWYGASEFATFAGGRLPTEAEWEYSCRAGTNTPFNTGICLSYAQANYNWTLPYDNCTNFSNTFPGTSQAVGIYPANAYGLYDMHGNVFEWCSDWKGTYPTSDEIDPTGPITGGFHVLRGGGWNYAALDSRSAFRGYEIPPGGYSYILGFRVVLFP